MTQEIVVLKWTKCKEGGQAGRVTKMMLMFARFYDRVTKIQIIHPFAIQVLNKFQFNLRRVQELMNVSSTCH